MHVKRRAARPRRQRTLDRQNSLAIGVTDSAHPQNLPRAPVFQLQEIIHRYPQNSDDVMEKSDVSSPEIWRRFYHWETNWGPPTDRTSTSVQEKVNFLPGPAERAAKGAHDPAHQSDDYQHKCESDRRRQIRMLRGKPREEHSERVFPQTQCDIGKRFRIRSHSCTNGRLTTM